MLLNLKACAPALILAAGYFAVSSARDQKAVPLAAPIESVLPGVEGYQVRDQKISAEERRIAGMTKYVARVFTRDSVLGFTTLVSYYDRQTRGKSIHSPRNCLPGAGWSILTGGREQLTANGVPYSINRVILKNGSSRVVVYYWYQGRGRVVASEYTVKWNLLRDAALLGHTEEALVRVVVPVHDVASTRLDRPDTGIAQASELGRTITQRLIGEVNRILPASGPA